MSGYIKRKIIHSVSGSREDTYDNVTVEEPLEIRIYYENNTYNVSVIMRTPVDDFALAAGFLFTEGIIKPENIIDIKYSEDANLSEKDNIVIVSVKSFEKQLIGNRNSIHSSFLDNFKARPATYLQYCFRASVYPF